MIPVPFWALTRSQKVWRRGENRWLELLRLDLLVRAIEEWESILSGGMELAGTLLARLEKMVRFNDLLHPVSSLQPRCRRSPMRLPSSQSGLPRSN